MAQHAVRLRLLDILDSIRGIQDTIAGVAFETYCEVWHMRRATERGLEMISEASRHIPAELKALTPEIPWPQIAGIGNVLRHDYERVEDAIVWSTATTQLEPLERTVRWLLTELDAGKLGPSGQKS